MGYKELLINLDQTEIAQFDTLAEAWWDTDGELKMLHRINPTRLAFIKKYWYERQATLVNKKILDVGCGGGILSESLAREGALLTGIDASRTAIDAGKAHAQGIGLDINYRTITVEALVDTCPAYFDMVTCMELLEHVPDPAAVISACARLLKPGGLVFFSTINRTLKAYALAIVAAEYALKLIPKGTHHYEKFIQPAELDRWAREAKLESVALSGMHYNPLTGQAKLCSDAAVNFLVCYENPQTDSRSPQTLKR